MGQLTELWSVADCCGDLVLAGGVIYASSGTADVMAIEASTGAILWTAVLDSSVRLDPIVADGMVFVGLLDGTIASLDAATGEVVWSVLLAPSNGFARLSADAERLYVPIEDKTLTALDLQNGTTVWEVRLSARPTAPAVAGGVVYVGATAGTYALDAATGARIWTSPASCFDCEAVTYSSGLVFTGYLDGQSFSALDAATGQPVWSVNLDHGTSHETAPTAADGVLYLPTADLGWFYALDASTGEILWRNQDSDFWAASPAVANGVVYVANDDYGLFAYDAVTGQRLLSVYEWVAYSPPIVADGRVYVVLADSLVALGLPGG